MIELDDFLDRIVKGDSLAVLSEIPENSIDLIATSPPYADRRGKPFKGVKPEEYVGCFLPISKKLKRVLGSGKQVMIFERAGSTRTLKNHYTYGTTEY